jgi:long-chain acyl-CoA synthetase
MQTTAQKPSPKPSSVSGDLVLGRSLVSLLDEACEQHPNPTAFNDHSQQGWVALSNTEFRRRAENLALGLLNLGLSRGDKVGLFMNSDAAFCLADMACLIAGLVDVPIYLTHSPEAIKFILIQSEAKVLVASDEGLAKQVENLVAETLVKHVVLAKGDGVSFAKLEKHGERIRTETPELLKQLKSQIGAHDLATIIYTSGTTGMPKGVMLTHENISSNAIAAFTGLVGLERGREVALSFLPLSHIFARTLSYCLMWYGASTYFSHPDLIRDHFKEIQPTFFVTVPRVMEKVYERIMSTGASLHGVKKNLFDWSYNLAQRYDVNQKPTGLYALQMALADKLVFSKWRDGFGGRVKFICSGGAAMRADLINIFAAAGIPILQGYGLTESSPVITFNRPGSNKAGSVGPALQGVEVKLTEQGEILSRGPHIMKGYFKNPEATQETIDSEGWLHTGDLGEMDAEGYLKITGRIKNLFKLSTGKYVMPQPLEERLESSVMIDTALIVGDNEKYCAALLFVNQTSLQTLKSSTQGLDVLKDADVQAHIKSLVVSANTGLSSWETIKKVCLVLDELTIQNGMLTPKLSVKRHEVMKKYKDAVDEFYRPSSRKLERAVIIDVESTAVA